MTISSQTTVHSYVGDGQQSKWPILFIFLSPEHVKAIRTTSAGVENTLRYGADYQVEALEGGGGQCTASVARGEKLTLYLDVPITQDTDLRNTGLLRAEVIERMSDKLTLVAQQHQNMIERCVKVSRSSSLKPDAMLNALTVAADKADQTHAQVTELYGDTVEIKKATQNVHAASLSLKTEMDALLITMNAQGQAKVDAAQQKVVAAGEAGKTQVNQAKVQVQLAKDQVEAAKAQVTLAKAQVTLAKGQVGKAENCVSEIQDSMKAIGSSILSGMVFPFNGTVNSNGFPVNRETGKEERNYALCDGRTYTALDGASITTPDLRDRFIVGAGAAYSQGDTGGTSAVTLTKEQMPNHAHPVVINGCGGITRPSYTIPYEPQTRGKPWDLMYANGGSQEHENRPPYYALAFIMKL